MGGRGGRGAGGGGAPAAAPATPTNDVEKARAALQATLDDTGAKPEAIKEKLAALRDAKEKVRQELDKATTDLKSVLSVRQEALLVVAGTFE
jgi:septal ring factor EnvC (AmiA/AmiB activator)